MTTEPTDEPLTAAFVEVRAALVSGEAARRGTPPPQLLILVTTVPWVVSLFTDHSLFALVTVLGLWVSWFIARRLGR